ncbi:MAG: RDD family protein, partial [Terriglobia bacterium]
HQPDEDPADIMLDQIVDSTLRISALGLVDIYRQAYPHGGMNLLVVVDQFEELFRYRKLAAGGDDPNRYGPSEESIAFVKLLLEASAQRECPIYVVLTMRSDFLGDCSQLDGLAEAINEGQFLVPRMSRAERRTAISGPVAVGGRKIDPVLLTRLMNDVGDNPDQLSILQHALNRTWARAGHDTAAQGELLPAHYDEIGSMAHALDRHADKAWDELTTPRQQEICEKVFRALTDTGLDPRGIRRPTQLSTLCELADASQAEVAEVLAPFRKQSRSFLMPPLPTPPARDVLRPDTVIDISHESLMRVWEKLRGWAEKEARSARLYRRVAETASLYRDGRAGLLRDRELETLLEWWETEKPNEAWARQYQGDWKSVAAFVEESKRAHHLELAEEEFDRKWRKVWRPIVLAVFFAVCLYPLLIGVKTTFDSFSRAQATHQSEHQTAERGSSGRQMTLSLDIEFLAPFFYLSLCFTALGTGLAGVAWAGRRVYRHVAFEDILKEVSSRTARKEAAAATVLVKAGPAAALPGTYPVWWRRLVAWIVDLIVFIVLVLLVVVCIYYLETNDLLPGNRVLYVLYGGILGADWMYETLLVRSGWQGTLGMRVMGFMVTDLAGRRISFVQASARHFAKLLCWLTCGIGFAAQLFTPKKQGLHEWITGCIAVRRPARVRPTSMPKAI